MSKDQIKNKKVWWPKVKKKGLELTPHLFIKQKSCQIFFV